MNLRLPLLPLASKSHRFPIAQNRPATRADPLPPWNSARPPRKRKACSKPERSITSSPKMPRFAFVNSRSELRPYAQNETSRNHGDRTHVPRIVPKKLSAASKRAFRFRQRRQRQWAPKDQPEIARIRAKLSIPLAANVSTSATNEIRQMSSPTSTPTHIVSVLTPDALIEIRNEITALNRSTNSETNQAHRINTTRSPIDTLPKARTNQSKSPAPTDRPKHPPRVKSVDTLPPNSKLHALFLSTYESESSPRQADKKRIMILGGGPNGSAKANRVRLLFAANASSPSETRQSTR